MEQVPILLATINAKWIHPSLALRLLKANLGEYETHSEILEFALRQPLEEKTAPVLAARPRILGISVSIWNHRAVLELLKALDAAWGRQEAPRPVVVLGGPEVSHLDEDAEILRYADWIIRGDGELVFRDLCAVLLGTPTEIRRIIEPSDRGSPLDKTVSLSLIADLPSVKEVKGQFIEAKPVNLRGIKSGYRLYTEEDLSRKLVYVEASRGCPFGCAFCLSAAEKEVREFPLEQFLEEMSSLIEKGARAFKFLDRSFNLNTRRARQIMDFFCNKIKGQENPQSHSAQGRSAQGCSAQDSALYVHFEIVPSLLPAELREGLTRFPPGSLRLELGIQTFNRETAALINRASNPEGELEALEFLRRETNAIIHADLIAGLPGEDLGSFGKGFDRLWQALSVPRRSTAMGGAATGEGPRGEIQLGILKRLPGTPLAGWNGKYGMVFSPEPPYEVRETAVLSAASLDRLRNFARFWELIVNRGSFPAFVPRFLPPGEPVFEKFMDLAENLFARFGRNWGIDRKELEKTLGQY
jgi:radical SAM superfamily enzyme YgiQ (UPF0313 family)